MSATVLRDDRLTALGFVHGFSTREGGVSAGSYASLNLATHVGDEPASVLENRRRFGAAVGFDPAALFECHQVHGAQVVQLRGADRREAIEGLKADALVTGASGQAVGVRVADCVPLLLAHPGTGAVAAVHVGWRGVVSHVAGEALRSLGVPPHELVAALGPSLGPCCFEVGTDVAAQLAQAAGDGVVLGRPNARPHVDLWLSVEQQLRRAGVREVHTIGLCTACDPQRFFSYRRDGKPMGQLLAVIVSRQ